jgi:formyl-CoA transferase
MLLEFEHPVLGPLTVVSSPVHLSEAPVVLRHAPPRLGEHTEEIIAELDLRPAARAVG